MTNPDFWYEWQPVAYRLDTMHLTPEQDGIYRRLIDWYMENARPLPENILAQAGIARVSEQCYSDAWRILSAFFTHREGVGYFSKKCEQKLTEMKKRHEARVGAAKVGADARWKKHKENQQPVCEPHSNRIATGYESDANGMRSNATSTSTSKRGMSNDLPPLSGGAREESFNNSQKPSVEIAAGFDDFFTRYPANGSPRTPAFHAYEAALKEGATHDRIISKLAEYLEYCSLTATRTCHAATWLRDKRFEVDYEAAFATWSAAQSAGKPAHAGPGGKSERWRRGFAAAIAEVIE